MPHPPGGGVRGGEDVRVDGPFEKYTARTVV